MKSITIDNSKTPIEIEDSECYRRANAACSNSCPFFEHQPTNPSLGDIVILTCNTYQALLLVSGYTT